MNNQAETAIIILIVLKGSGLNSASKHNVSLTTLLREFKGFLSLKIYPNKLINVYSRSFIF
jgi:hypothetical protein